MTTSTQPADTVLSVRTTQATRERLQQLAKTTRRTSSSLANEALEQYVAHQDWMAREIERGVQSANKGKLVSDSTITAWIETLER
jgi:predicted transcriptional regulator